MSFLLNKLDRWIYDSFPLNAEQLGFYRITYGIFIIFILGTPSVRWIAPMHDGMFHPPHPSIASLAFSGFLSYPILYTIDLLVIIFAFGILFGVKTRTSSVLFTATIVFGKSFEYSLGKINHDFIVYLVPAILAFANWGQAYSFDARKNKTSIAMWPITLMCVILGFSIFTSGWPKLMAHWLSFETLAVKGKLFTNYFVQDRQDLLAGFWINVQSPLIWEMNDWAAVLLELAFLPAVFFPRMMRVLIGWIMLFHTMVLFMLNIVFVPIYIIYLLIAWPVIPLPTQKFEAIFKRFQWKHALAIFITYLVARGIFLLPVTLWGLFDRIPVPYLLPMLINLAGIVLVIYLTRRALPRTFRLASTHPDE